MKNPETIEYKLAMLQLGTFQKDQLGYLNGLIGCDSVRKLMLSLYLNFVNGNKLSAIETLTENEKKDIWLTANDIVGDKLERDALVQFAKILYFLEYLLSIEV